MGDNKKDDKSQDLEIVELRIQMHTNMDSQVELTADQIDNKKVSGKYPLLCTNCEYSKDILVHKTLNERFDTFFNRTKFYNFIVASKLKKNQKVSGRYKKDIVRENIIIMLNSLFPISFPIKDQITLMDDENLNLINTIRNLFKTDEYTYLKLNKPSTVTQIIWLNTISSNPIYYQLYKKNKNYYKKVFDYVENVNSREIKEIVPKDISDIQKIQEITKLVDDVKTLNQKEEWILHFLVKGYKKNTREYNSFIKEYVTKFINPDQQNARYYNYGQGQDQYEKQFVESVPEIKFYFKYITEIVDFLPPKRISVDSQIAETLKIAKDSNNFTEFRKIFGGEDRKKYCDLIRLENGGYEIHLGVAVVGGKVNQTNYKFFCNYNSHRLGNDLNYLIKDIEDESDKIRLYSYIDLENVKDTREYVGVVNSSVKRNDAEAENEMKREREKGLERGWRGGKTRKKRKNNQRTRRLIQRDFKKK